MTTQPRPRTRAPKIGDLVDGKYRLERELGRGGMGRVFAADHLLLDAKVALKFLHPHLAHDPISVSRFAREAHAAATLKSHYAARIIDVDQLPTGELYIVMEYLEGTSLEAVAKDGHGMPIADAVKCAVQACDALAEAHERGIVHRDVKPANLFLTKGKSGDGVVKVLDFGLAKSDLPDGFPGGKVQALGTPQYMSPEQIGAASDLDGRSDVWSMGATLYELLAGRAAFAASGPLAVFARILESDYTPLHVHRPDVPAELVAIIDRCLRRDRTARFATARELAQALQALSAPSASSVHVATTSACKATLVSPSDPLVAIAKPSEPRVSWSPPLPSPPAAMVHRPSYPSMPPSALSSVAPVAWTPPTPPTDVAPFGGWQQAGGSRGREPTLRQTLVAALAGPLLVAIAAGAMAVTLAMGPALRAAGRAPAMQAAESSHITAKSATSAPRTKAVSPQVQVVSARCARNPRGAMCGARN